VVGRAHDRVDGEHQGAGDEGGASDVRPLREADAFVPIEQPHRQQRRRDPDRQVDEEDPVPVDRLGEHAARQQADGAAGRCDEAVDPDRPSLLARLGEHGDDHAQDHGRRHGTADALHEPRPNQQGLALRQAAHERRGGEDRQADQEDAPAADEVAQPPGEQQQTSERDQVCVDHPGKARLREAQIALNRGQRHVHDRGVEDDHQHAHAEHHKRHPAGPVAHCVCVPGRFGGLGHLVASLVRERVQERP
jgi:hypothetical protein